MNREDIIRMAREAGMGGSLVDERDVYNSIIVELERFATLVASAERKACVEVIKDNWIYTANAEEMVYYILERGQA